MLTTILRVLQPWIVKAKHMKTKTKVLKPVHNKHWRRSGKKWANSGHKGNRFWKCNAVVVVFLILSHNSEEHNQLLVGCFAIQLPLPVTGAVSYCRRNYLCHGLLLLLCWFCIAVPELHCSLPVLVNVFDFLGMCCSGVRLNWKELLQYLA